MSGWTASVGASCGTWRVETSGTCGRGRIGAAAGAIGMVVGDGPSISETVLAMFASC